MVLFYSPAGSRKSGKSSISKIKCSYLGALNIRSFENPFPGTENIGK